MRSLLLMLMLVGTSALAQDTFHGWSKDGSWLVIEREEANERAELLFCATSPDVRPSWPKSLESLEREDEGSLSCVRFIDINKAPYEWRRQLVLPKPSARAGGLSVHAELVTDGETPGFVLESQDKTQGCYASGVRESSKLQQTWFHPSGRYVGALIDGNFHHCVVTLLPAKAPTRTPTRRKK